MSKKKSIFGRISALAKANVNAAIDAAEDPKLMLDQTIREFDNNIAEAEKAISVNIGNLRQLEDDHKTDLKDAAEWGRKAQAAMNRSTTLAEAGDQAGAAKFENLARVALENQVREEKEAADKKAIIDPQNVMVEKLKAGLNDMKAKRTALVSKRDELVARDRNAKAQNTMMDAAKSIDFLDPSSEIGRFEEKIRREEARAVGSAELLESSLDNQFEELDTLGSSSEVADRLAALKAK